MHLCLSACGCSIPPDLSTRATKILGCGIGMPAHNRAEFQLEGTGAPSQASPPPELWGPDFSSFFLSVKAQRHMSANYGRRNILHDLLWG